MDNEQLKRIADALEEVLRLVKEDQERSKKYTYSKNEDDFMGSENRIESEQETRLGEYPGPPEPLAMAQGSRTKLQAASGKLQAPSSKLDKTTLQ